MPGCITDAGILKDDKLSTDAKRLFIERVKAELVMGTAKAPPSPFPCGPSVPPMPYADKLPLEDEKLFPDFHKNVLGQYEKIAKALDTPSRFTVLPICCPVALAVKLGAPVPDMKFPQDYLTYGFALPLLAIKLGFPMPVDLAKKIPSIISLPIPSLNIPSLDFDPKSFPDLLALNGALFGAPPALLKLIPTLLAKIPQLLIGILQFDFRPFCDAVLETKMFGSFDHGKSLTWIVAQKVLALKVAELLLINIIGSTIGSSSGGIVGVVSQFLGFKPPPGPTVTPNSPLQSCTKAAQAAKDASWSADRSSLNKPPQEVSLTYTTFLLPQEVDDGRDGKAIVAHEGLRDRPAGALFGRACLLRAGATAKFFTQALQGDPVAQLRSECSKVDGVVLATNGTLPSMRAGDLLVFDSSCVALTEGSNGTTFKGIMGGARDAQNDGRLTKVVEVTGTLSGEAAGVVFTFDGQRYVFDYAINVEKVANG